jgi:hypothetical protein
VPLLRIADEVVGLGVAFPLALRDECGVPTDDFQTDDVRGIALPDAEHRVPAGQPHAVAAAAREEIDLRIGLAEILLESQRHGGELRPRYRRCARRWRDGRRRRCRIGGRRLVQQPIPHALLGGTHDYAGLHGSDLVLQVPIAAQALIAGRVVTRADIGAGQSRERIDQRAPRVRLRHVATVQQHVGVLVQRHRPSA